MPGRRRLRRHKRGAMREQRAAGFRFMARYASCAIRRGAEVGAYQAILGLFCLFDERFAAMPRDVM